MLWPTRKVTNPHYANPKPAHSLVMRKNTCMFLLQTASSTRPSTKILTITATTWTTGPRTGSPTHRVASYSADLWPTPALTSSRTTFTRRDAGAKTPRPAQSRTMAWCRAAPFVNSKVKTESWIRDLQKWRPHWRERGGVSKIPKICGQTVYKYCGQGVKKSQKLVDVIHGSPESV